MTEPEYPEHQKLEEISRESHAIGEFLEWLEESKKVRRMVWCDEMVEGPCPEQSLNPDMEFCIGGKRKSPSGRMLEEDCRLCHGTSIYRQRVQEWRPLNTSIIDLLAEYYGIDQKRLESEKRQMLQRIRERGGTCNANTAPDSVSGTG